jgi:hypothetical protein
MFPAEVGNMDHRHEEEDFQRSKAELFVVVERSWPLFLEGK